MKQWTVSLSLLLLAGCVADTESLIPEGFGAPDQSTRDRLDELQLPALAFIVTIFSPFDASGRSVVPEDVGVFRPRSRYERREPSPPPGLVTTTNRIFNLLEDWDEPWPELLKPVGDFEFESPSGFLVEIQADTPPVGSFERSFAPLLEARGCLRADEDQSLEASGCITMEETSQIRFASVLPDGFALEANALGFHIRNVSYECRTTNCDDLSWVPIRVDRISASGNETSVAYLTDPAGSIWDNEWRESCADGSRIRATVIGTDLTQTLDLPCP